jgi:hypothetical protein
MSTAKKTENKSNGNAGAQFVKDSPIGPFIKTPGQSSNLETLIRRDHPEGLNAALQTSFANQRGKAQGFIPNFAPEDTAPADIGSSIGALATQLGGLAFMLSFSKGQYQTALAELTQSNVATAKANALLALQTQRAAGGMAGAGSSVARFDAQIKAAGAGTFAQKAGAGIGTNALIISLLGPILAETAANAIGKEDKTSRVGSSGVSALGQAATFAGFGAMLTPVNPLLGAGIGAAAGGLLGLVDVIKQASTDIPELSAAAQKASENLTKINDAGQKVQTSFEQIKGLRESGQGERAGVAETELLRFVRKEFRDSPDFSARIQTAIENNDTKALQDAIGENTKAILDNSQSQERNLLIGKLVEGAGGKNAGVEFQDIINLENLDLSELDKLSEISRQASKIQPDVVRKVTEGESFGNPANTQAFDNAGKINKDLINLIESLNLPKENIDRLKQALKDDPALGIEALNAIRDPTSQILEAAKKAAQGSRSVNKVIDVILTTLEKIQSNYKKLASQTQTAFDLQLTAQASQRTAKSNIKVSDLQKDALTEELFAVPKRPGQLDKGTEAELAKIDNDFTNNIKNSIDQGVGAIGSGLISQLESSIAKLSGIGDGGSAQPNALANLQESKKLLSVLQNPQTGELDQTVFEKISKILDVGDIASFKGFDDIDGKVEEIAKLIGITNNDDEDSQKRLDAIREALNKTNIELVKNKAVLIEQKRILANQKFGESLRELITSLNTAFGGLQAFINDDISITSALNKAIANLKIIGEPSGETSFIEVGRNLQRVLSELSKILGTNIGPALGEDSEIIKAITDARALDVENQLQNIIKGLGGIGGEKGQELIAALRKTLEERGIENAQNLSLPELVKAFSETVAERQVQTENAVGEIDKVIIDQAQANLPPELQKYLGDIDLQFLPTEDLIKIQFVQANATLLKILDAITGAEQKLFVPNPNLDKFAPEPDLQNSLYPRTTPYSAASGYIPPKAMPAMMAESVDIANGVGGALPSDRPEVIRNFNGSMVVANEGEKLRRNFMGTGEDALLTREMQNMAEGYLPSLKGSRSTGKGQISEGMRGIDSVLNSPERQLQSRIFQIQSELRKLPRPGEFGYKDGDSDRIRELERELTLLQNPKAEILTRDGVKRNPYFDKNGKYIGGKKKTGLKSQIENMAEGYLPSLKGSRSTGKGQISEGMRGIDSVLNSPERQLQSRIFQIQSELRKLPRPGEFGYKDGDSDRIRELERELTLLQNPKAEILTRDGVKRNPYFDKNGKYIGGKKKTGLKSQIENMAEGYIPNMAEGSIPPELTEVKFDLVKRALEVNEKYAEEYAPIDQNINKTRAYLERLEEQAFQSFAEKWIPKQKELFESDPELAKERYYEPTMEGAKSIFEFYQNSEPEKYRDYKIYSDATSALSPEIQKAEKAIQLLSGEKESVLRKLREEIKSEALRKEFENIGVDPDEFISPELTSYSDLFQKQKEVNRPRMQDKATSAAAKRQGEINRKSAKTQAIIQRSREVLAKSYEASGDRYEIDEFSGKQFTVDAARLGLRGAGAGGTFNTATAIDRAGLEPTREIRRAERTSQPNAKFMLQSLVEAYTQALSGQERGRPTGAKMDQKRALMAKTREFKRLYEQGKYESLREIYEKHEKNDPVKQAYSELAAQGIDPNEGYDRAMAYAKDQEALYQRSRLARSYGAEAGYIDGRPAQEVLAEGQSSRPSDPAYDAAMRAAGLNPETGAPNYSPVSQGSLIDGRPAQEVLDEMEKENASSRIRNYAQGFLPKMESFMAEMGAGFDSDQVYPKSQPELQGLNNPQGKAYFNNVQEGTTAKERIAMGNRMNIPNFANSIPESAPASISLGGLTINEAQTGGKSKEYSADFAKDWEEKASALALQIKGEMDQKYGRAMEIVAAGERNGSLPRVPPKSRGVV